MKWLLKIASIVSYLAAVYYLVLCVSIFFVDTLLDAWIVAPPLILSSFWMVYVAGEYKKFANKKTK